MELRVCPQKYNNFFDTFANSNEIGYYPEPREDRNVLFGDVVDTHERYVPHCLDVQGSCGASFSARYSPMQCIDFEERGFCLLGDMCPMEHGAHKIVVDDVQSLYQYNLQLRPSSQGSENAEVASPPSSGVHSLTGGDGSTDSYDPDHPLLTDLSLKIPSPTYPILPLSPVRTTSSSHTYSGTRPFRPPIDSKRKTLYVGRIPRKDNIREALLSHFSRFGHISGIHIPSGRDEAFVRFSKREEAVAALRAPDALMGNRFVVLRWAKRDCFPDIDALSVPRPENLKSLNDIEKKLGVLEDERSRFVSRVSQFQKAAAAKKAVDVRKKQNKEDNCGLESPLDENIPDDGSPQGMIFNKRARSQISSRIHPRSFSIIPPLPPGFSDVAVLREHFSRFGNVSVEIRDGDSRDSSRILVPFVTFTTRSDAETAFMRGAVWNGHMLCFRWLMPGQAGPFS